jgi:hypothetical protein
LLVLCYFIWQQYSPLSLVSKLKIGIGQDLTTNTPVQCVGVYIVMVCPWAEHILARNPFLEVEADLS